MTDNLKRLGSLGADEAIIDLYLRLLSHELLCLRITTFGEREGGDVCREGIGCEES
jgi:hypothetical protein